MYKLNKLYIKILTREPNRWQEGFVRKPDPIGPHDALVHVVAAGCKQTGHATGQHQTQPEVVGKGARTC